MSKIEVIKNDATLGWVGFVAYVAALVYFINTANGFWEVVFAFIQAAVWPGIVLYEVLVNLGV